MMRATLPLAAAAAMALAACSGERANEATSANEVAAEAPNEALPAEEAANVSANLAAEEEPSASPPEVERPLQVAPRRGKTERPAPKEEPVDPHAGHDMNNMAH